MAGINFLSENYVDDSVLNITTGSANAQFPLDNLKNDFTTKKFRSGANTVVFTVDFQQFREVDFVAITGDQTETLGITAASIKFSTTLDFTLSTVYNLDISGKYNYGFVEVAEGGPRYAEVTLTGTGSYSELGKIFIGKKVTLQSNSISVSSFRLSREDKSTTRENRYGQKFIDIRNNIKRVSGNIEVMTKAEMDIVDELYIYHGKNKPIWLVLDLNSDAMIDGKYKLSFYSYFSSDPSYRALGGQNYTVNVSMELVV